MDIELNEEDSEFRAEVRTFLEENFTEDLRKDTQKQAGVFADYDLAIRWHKILYNKGWIVPSWPVELGGTGWNDMQRYIYSAECARAGTPSLSALGLRMCGPVIIGYGTQEQKDFYLPRILSGEDYWCQGYSEPGAGSDLASLQTKAVRDGDEYVVNGTKIWTTHAQFANRMFCLVRTNPEGKPQAGISFLLIDMDTPGITVEPIITMAGDHEVNQVFLDDVRVPVKNLVGEENDGWTVAKYLLEFERGGSYSAGLKVALEKIRGIASIEHSGTGDRLIDDPSFLNKIVEMEMASLAMEFTEHRIMSNLSTGQNPGAASSILKLRGTENIQRLTELSIEAIGYYNMPDQLEGRHLNSNVPPIGPDHALTSTARYLNTRASTIFGGSSEVQKNIMAKLVLGL